MSMTKRQLDDIIYMKMEEEGLDYKRNTTKEGEYFLKPRDPPADAFYDYVPWHRTLVLLQ